MSTITHSTREIKPREEVFATLRECEKLEREYQELLSCPECEERHDPSGDSWDGWDDQTTWGLPPYEGEGRGRAGSDVGPAEPGFDGDEDESFADELLEAIGPGCLDGPRLTLAEAIEVRAIAFASEGTSLGDYLAELMTDLAERVRIVKAVSIQQFAERDAALTENYEHELYTRGYESGLILQ